MVKRESRGLDGLSLRHNIDIGTRGCSGGLIQEKCMHHVKHTSKLVWEGRSEEIPLQKSG